MIETDFVTSQLIYKIQNLRYLKQFNNHLHYLILQTKFKFMLPIKKKVFFITFTRKTFNFVWGTILSME